MRAEYSTARCNTAQMIRVTFPGPVSQTQWSLLVESHTAPAWRVFANVMERHDYLFKESAGGTYNCRQIAGTTLWSLHSYGLALDLNPSKNGPQGSSTCDQPTAFRAAIKAIVTKSGRRVFAWGGDWSGGSQDPMHWQVGATKAEIASGVIDPGEDEMNDADWIKLRAIVNDEVAKVMEDLLAMNDAQTSAIGRTVWQHKGKDAEGNLHDKSMGTVQRGTYNTVTK